MKVPEAWRQRIQQRKPRAGFDGLLYYEICSEACTLTNQMMAEVEILIPRRDHRLMRTVSGAKFSDLFAKIHKQEAITITFAAICLESCIWDYAACGTTQKKAEKIFGSLNLVAKWILIPHFLCGLDITKKRIDGTCLLGRLRKLTKARNELVHSKSKTWPDDKKEFMKQVLTQRKITAEDAFGLIKLLLGELEKVDTTNWWLFKKDAYRNYIKKP